MDQYRDYSKVPVFIGWMHPQEELNLHLHNYYELVLILSGSGDHLLPDASWPVEAGDVFVIPPGTRHGYDNCEDLHLVNLCIDQQWCERDTLRSLAGFTSFISLEPLLRKEQRFAQRLRINPEQQEDFCNDIRLMQNDMKAKRSGHILSVGHRLDLILIECARLFGERHNSQNEALFHLEQTLHFIDENLERVLDLEQLSQQAAMSVSTLTRYFHKCFGCSPIQFVLSKRIAMAKDLLRNSNTSIQDIAKQCGFKDANYFSRIFKQHGQQSPRTYRSQFTEVL